MTTALYLAHLNPVTNAHVEIIKELKKEADIVKVMPVIFKLLVINLMKMASGEVKVIETLFTFKYLMLVII